MPNLRFPLQLAMVLVACFAVALQAQNLTVAPRIVGEVDNASRTVLKGNVSLKARTEFDQGAAPANTPMTGMHLLLSRSKDQEAALKQYMAEQLEKSSPNYHKWLTPEQLGKLYGPADSDINKVVTWLRSQGLNVVQVSPARTSITFSGTAQQVEQAFRVSVHSFKAGSETFLSNTADPSIPSALAPVVSGVAQLNTIRPKPHSIKAGSAQLDPKLGRLVFKKAEKTAISGPHANLTEQDSSGNNYLLVVPGDAATIYDTPNSFNANFSSSSTSYTGSGVTIGIGGESVIKSSTVSNYRSTFLGDSSGDQPTITYCSSDQSDSNVTSISVSCSSSSSSLSDGSVKDGVDEAYLDNEVSGGLAPGATIHYYASSDLMSAVQYAIDNNAVDIMSLSFGSCEWGMSSSDNSYYNDLWQQAASQGIVVAVSSGDSGSAGCDIDTAPYAAYGLQVSGIASTPYNIAVGGTDYYPLRDQSNFTNYVSTTNSSSTYYRTALKYIPESAWNDSASTDWNNSSSSTYEYNSAYGYPLTTNIVGGSGGKSSCSTNTTSDSSSDPGSCASGYSKPSWQTGTGVPSDGVRDLPDVSLLAADGADYASWAICTDDSDGHGHTENCSTKSAGVPYVSAVGGTSASAPAFAGMLALVQQATCPSGSSGSSCRLGLDAVKTLYDLFNGSNSSSVFHDVTVGNNSVYCYSNSTDYQYDSTIAKECQENNESYYFLSGYNAGTGYDLATGLGSVDVSQLIKYWSTAAGSGSATVSASASSSSIYSGSSVSVSVTVSGASSLGTPTGTVSLSGGGYTSSATTLSNGSATITIPANSLESGSDTLTVTYSGDLNYASSTGTTSVTVTQSTFSLSATSPSSISAGGSATSTITASTSSNYSGTVTLSCSLTSSPSSANSTYSPICSISPSSISLSSSSTSATATATVTTTGSSSTSSAMKSSSTASIAPVANHRGRGGWTGAGGGALLELMLFLGMPARRRSWRAMLSILGVVVLMSGLSSCSSSSTKTTSTSTTLSASSTSVTTGSSVTLTASVSPSAATGTVTFYDGSTSLGSSSLSSGSATLKTSFSSAGTHSITASYAGSGGYSASTSSATSIKVSSGTTSGTYTFTVTGSGSSSSSSTSTMFTVTVN